MTTSATLQQIEQIERLMAVTLSKANPTKDGAQCLIERGNGFMTYIMAGITRFTAAGRVPGLAFAHKVLGDDFISPEEIAAARGLAYSEKQLAEFEHTLPHKETIEWLRRNNYYLVAGPPSALSLRDVREFDQSYFHRKRSDQHAESKADFVCTEKVTCRWYMFCKDVMQNSLNKSLNEQQKLLSPLESIPTAVEIIWGMTCYRAVRGIYLYGSSRYIRTASIGSRGGHVLVGGFDGDGLGFGILGGGDDRHGEVIGISPARRY